VTFTLIRADARHIPLADESVQMCCTSPPYWNLRRYGIGAENGELGQESTPEEYIAKMVEVFHEVKRVLRSDGVLFVNIGDSYARQAGLEESKRKSWHTSSTGQAKIQRDGHYPDKKNRPPPGLKPKDLVGIPWMPCGNSLDACLCATG